MSTLNNMLSCPKEHCLKGIENWILFKSYLISAIQSKGLSSYLDGSILPPTKSTTPTAPLPGPTMFSTPTTTTPIYLTSLSLKKWIFWEGYVSGIMTSKLRQLSYHTQCYERMKRTRWSLLVDCTTYLYTISICLCVRSCRLYWSRDIVLCSGQIICICVKKKCFYWGCIMFFLSYFVCLLGHKIFTQPGIYCLTDYCPNTRVDYHFTEKIPTLSSLLESDYYSSA